jgi:hypothetical protein
MLSAFLHSFLPFFHDSSVLPLILSSSHILSHPFLSSHILSPHRAIELYLEDQSAIKSKIAADEKHRVLLISNGTLDPNTPVPAPPAVGEGISNMIVKKAADEYKEVLTGKKCTVLRHLQNLYYCLTQVFHHFVSIYPLYFYIASLFMHLSSFLFSHFL